MQVFVSWVARHAVTAAVPIPRKGYLLRGLPTQVTEWIVSERENETKVCNSAFLIIICSICSIRLFSFCSAAAALQLRSIFSKKKKLPYFSRLLFPASSLPILSKLHIVGNRGTRNSSSIASSTILLLLCIATAGGPFVADSRHARQRKRRLAASVFFLDGLRRSGGFPGGG